MDLTALRIIDANLNRAREGLRVLEDYARFALEDAHVAERVKHARHALVESVRLLDRRSLLAARDTLNDVGTDLETLAESTRNNAAAVARAAAARAVEALRCVEEYGKIVSATFARRIERLRYDCYMIEQDVLIASPRRKRLRDARLHVLLTESLCRGDWRETARAVLEAGANVIQLREKSLTDAELRRRTDVLRRLTDEFDALLVINDRADIARLAGADAVHLGQDDLSIADARRIAGPTVLVGRSTHDRAEIEAALAEGADYIGVGPMFASNTKPGVAVRGSDLLALAAHLTRTVGNAPTPIVAIGGITPDNVGRLCVSSPPPAVAVCAGIIGAADPPGTTRRLLNTLDAARIA